MRILVRIGAVLAFVTALLATVEVAVPQSAEAVQATGGSARFKAIEWIPWGTSAGQQIPNTGKTVTETSVIAGQTLAVTCSIANIARVSGSTNGNMLEAYRPGTWQGDGFDELYNIGGTGTDNQMIVGLSNRITSTAIKFNFSCSATLGGDPFPLGGLVMADAEASGNNEYVAATIPRTNAANQPTTWRIIDRVRGRDCNLAATARRSETASSNTLAMYGPQNNTCEGGNDNVRPGPSAIAFMEAATSATDVTVAGGGKSAIALGVLLDFDFGDAPESYEEAVSATQFAWSGGEVPLATGTFPTNRGVSLFDGFALASPAMPTPRLGALTDGELSQPYSADARGDDIRPASEPNDEDAVTLPSQVVVQPGGTFSQAVACTRSPAVGANVAGWIDWNLNGSFDAGERSTTAPACPAGGSVTLTWNVPAGVLPDGGIRQTYLRLRIAGSTESLNPTGRTHAGEVEDHRLTFTTPPRLVLDKRVDGRVSPGDQFRVTMAGAGLPGGGVAATTTGSQNSATTGAQLVQTGTTYTLTDQMAPGSTNQLDDYVASASCARADGTAVPVGGAAPQWTVSGLANGQVVRCTITNTPRPATVDVTKTPGTVSGPDAEGRFTATYDVAVRNTGPQATAYGALTDQAGFPANLAIDGASWTTDAPGVSNGSANGAGPWQLAPSGTALARQTTHTYQVTVRFHYRNDVQAAPCGGGSGNGLHNRAGLPAGQETGGLGDNAACLPPPPPPRRELLLDKEAGPVEDANGTGAVDAGDTVEFEFTVENTGQVRVDNLTIDDPTVGDVTCDVTALAPGGTAQCRATYRLTQGDIDAGVLDNVAVAQGDGADGRPVTSNEDTTSTSLPGSASLLLDKQAGNVQDTNSNGVVDAGDRIGYTFVVRNTGTTTVRRITLNDPAFPGVTCSPAALAPGASATCGPATRTLTQRDIDAGSVDNTATAEGVDPGGDRVPSNPDSTSTPLTASPGILLEKSVDRVVDANDSGITDAGDLIHYRFRVTNTGNVTLNVAVEDPLLGAVTCEATSLEPGRSTTCTAAPHAITDEEEADEEVVNEATAIGAPPPPARRTSNG